MPYTIGIDARKIQDFGIGTYVRNLILALARIDPDNRYVLLAKPADREALSGLPESFTVAVESCTNAFAPLAELDERRDKAKEARREADMEGARLGDLENTLLGALVAFTGPATEKKAAVTGQLAQKLSTTIKQSIADTRKQIDTRVASLEAQASPPRCVRSGCAPGAWRRDTSAASGGSGTPCGTRRRHRSTR